jgi:hypothetical protein
MILWAGWLVPGTGEETASVTFMPICHVPKGPAGGAGREDRQQGSEKPSLKGTEEETGGQQEQLPAWRLLTGGAKRSPLTSVTKRNLCFLALQVGTALATPPFPMAQPEP